MGNVLKFALLLLPAAVLALAYWANRRAGSTCEVALALSHQVPRAAQWIAASEADPFLAIQLGRAPIRRALRQFQAAAAIVRGDYGLLRLDFESKRQLSAIAEARNDSLLNQAVRDFSPIFLTQRCEGKGSVREEALALQVDAAEQDWALAKVEAGKDKAAFASDREIFCQLDSLRTELELVVQAAKDRCAARRGGKPCAAEVNDTLVREMTDLEQKRAFNLAKLERKWPAAVMEELKCGSSSL